MKTIEVEVDVFAKIWAERRDNEMSENDIIRRCFSELEQLRFSLKELAIDSTTAFKKRDSKEVLSSKLGGREAVKAFGKIRWVDDVQTALSQLGGKASLAQIYIVVERIRREANRSVPESLDATIRRTIEDHSSDSDNFRGVDIFRKVARGEWALR